MYLGLVQVGTQSGHVGLILARPTPPTPILLPARMQCHEIHNVEIQMQLQCNEIHFEIQLQCTEIHHNTNTITKH